MLKEFGGKKTFEENKMSRKQKIFRINERKIETEAKLA